MVHKYGKQSANAGFTESYLQACITLTHRAAICAFDGSGPKAVSGQHELS